MKALKQPYVIKSSDSGQRDSYVDMTLATTVFNLTGNPQELLSSIRYGYKKYQDQDFYIEAIDLSGNPLNIDGNVDYDYIVDPVDGRPGLSINAQRIIDTSFSLPYIFKPGKYKIRAVYDPANTLPVYDTANVTSSKSSLKPIYSNWEVIEVIKEQ